MATYELPYAEEHLTELFQEARTGEAVFIVRPDGRSCQLLPVADMKECAPVWKRFKISRLRFARSFVPAYR
jgi:hypothetical protein